MERIVPPIYHPRNGDVALNHVLNNLEVLIRTATFLSTQLLEQISRSYYVRGCNHDDDDDDDDNLMMMVMMIEVIPACDDTGDGGGSSGGGSGH